MAGRPTRRTESSSRRRTTRLTTDVAERIVGVTPFAPNGRYREILAYLTENEAEGCRWVFVDDDPVSYPAGVPLILVDPAMGFTAEQADRLV